MEILVEGSAERMVSPDVGELFLMLEQEGNDREFVVGLTSELARRFSEAVAPLRPASVVRWSLDPIRVHTWRPEEGTLRYRAMANSKILFRDFQALADFAVSWGSAPGVEIHYTDWRLSPETEQRLETELLTEAVAAGRRRAEAMATAAGAAITSCVELSDHQPVSGVAARGAWMGTTAASSDGGAVVEPRDVHLSVTVYARYQAG